MAFVGVTFLRDYHPWNAGERAGIDESEAARLVAKGDAVYRDKPAIQEPKQKNPSAVANKRSRGYRRTSRR